MKKKFAIIILILLLVFIGIDLYKINRYENYLIDDNNSQLISFCHAIINNHKVINKHNYMDFTINEIESLNNNYTLAIDIFLELTEKLGAL